MDPLWQHLTAFAQLHHGVITADEAHDLAIPTYRLAQWARGGRLVHAAPGTYTVAGMPSSWHQRLRVATGSGGAWASHRTAAALWNLDGFDGRVVEVVTERGRRRPRRNWKVHESRTLRTVDGALVDGLPATAVARTILDLPALPTR